MKSFNIRHDEVTYRPGEHYLYKWYRLWNSGYLEHGGIVQCKPVTRSRLEDTDYYISVDLSWDGTAPVYNYTETSGISDGDMYVRNYYGNAYGKSPVTESILATEMRLSGLRYTISITPIQFDYDRDVRSGKFADMSSLSAYCYPDTFLSNKVSSYVTTEVHHVKNGSFCFTKCNTDDLIDNSRMQLYAYHTTGFVKRGDG